MSTSRIDLVAGARPNFMKIAPVYHCITSSQSNLVPRIVHTGQHYDANLSDVFFADLGLPAPDVHLEVGSAPVAEQTARIMEAYDRVLQKDPPDRVLVVGDVNSTFACALAASQRGIPVAHLEAGLRSFDRSMPEEINRVLTDRLSDLLLTPSVDADANLQREGIDPARIRFVGNIMIDSLLAHRDRIEQSDILNEFQLQSGAYGLVTLHRPANVDDPETLASLLGTLAELARQIPLVLPAHPRLRRHLDALDPRVRSLLDQSPLRFVDAVGYIDFLALQASARVVLTDSGGIQEETTVLGVPCLTLRENTERPVTIHEGTNRLVGRDADRIREAFEEAVALPRPTARQPRFWDGRTAERVVAAIEAWCIQRESSPDGAVSGTSVTALPLPVVAAHRSAHVRRELLYVAETGAWQDDSDTARLGDRLASYTEAERVILCADITGGLAALRAQFSTGDVAVMGDVVPEDTATVLGHAVTGWRDPAAEAPSGVGMVYVPPVRLVDWSEIDPSAVLAAVARYPDTPFVIDERWFEFTGRTLAGHQHEHPNIIVLRSLGPSFGLQGLGTGYMLASQAFVPATLARAAEAALLPVGRRAAYAALIDLGYMREYVDTRRTTRDWLAQSLSKLGLKVQALPGPHLFITGEIPEALHKAEGIAMLDSGWLWAIGTPEQVEDLLEALENERQSVRS